MNQAYTALIKHYEGNTTALANDLGVEPATVRNHCKRYGIDIEAIKEKHKG